MRHKELVLTLKPNLFSRAATRVYQGSCTCSNRPSKQRSKAKMMLHMWGGTISDMHTPAISVKAGLLQAGAAQVPRLFTATRAHAYMATVPALWFSGSPCTQPRGRLLTHKLLMRLVLRSMVACCCSWLRRCGCICCICCSWDLKLHIVSSD